VSNEYEDTELPFPDAKVAKKLCIGGACYYLFTTSSGLVGKLTTWQSGLEVRITVVFLSAYH
jgi:hypothetical protein